MKRLSLAVVPMLFLALFLAACAGKSQVAEKIVTVEVEKVVTKEVVKEVPVEKIVTVQVEKVVTVEKEVPVEKVVTVEVEKVVTVEVEKAVVKGGELIFGLNLEPDNLDPAVTPWAVSHVVMMNIYDTLVWEGLDSTFAPGLAESWEVSADGKSYTFKLRRGVKFHDGTPFNAEAVKFTFDRIIDPETKSGFAITLLGPYAGSEVLDDYTIKVNFKEPFAPFLDSASQAFLGIVSPTAVKKYGEDFGLHPVGTGFMVFKEWVRGDHITLERNPDYNWAPPIFHHQGPAYLERIIIKMIPEASTRLATLETGETNFVSSVPEADVVRLAGNPKIALIFGPNPGLPFVEMINTDRFPTNDLAVRQAIFYALDRETARKIVAFGIPSPTYSPLATGTLGYNDTLEGMYPFDPDKARELLEGAGWKMGSGGVYEKNGKPLTLDVPAIESQKDRLTVLQAQLKQVGFDMKIRIMAASTWIDTAKAGDMNMADIGWVSSDPIILEQFFHSKNIEDGFNWPRYADAHMDEILDQASKSTDVAERMKLYGEVQKIAMEQALVYPLWDIIMIFAHSVDVVGIQPDVRGQYPWLYDAYVMEKR